MGSFTAAVCGCVTRTATRWHHPKVYSWPAVLTIRCSHYDVLGVPANATQKDIKAAFIDKSKKHHPDRNSDPNAQDIFAKCAEAYETLGKEKSRSEYDATLRSSSNMYRPPPQSAGQAPDPFQPFHSRSNPRPANPRQGRPPQRTASADNRDSHSWGWNEDEDVFLRMGRQCRNKYWSKACDKRSTQMNPRDAAQQGKKKWRNICIFAVSFGLLVHFASFLSFRSMKRKQEQRKRDRRELAKLRMQSSSGEHF